MSISANYPQPVQVNGFTCRNCSDVDLAKKHVDPQHPKSGPFGVDAAADPTQSFAVRFAGALSGVSGAASASPAKTTGAAVDLSV